jgi:lysophospholipase L1-like esterase
MKCYVFPLLALLLPISAACSAPSTNPPPNTPHGEATEAGDPTPATTQEPVPAIAAASASPPTVAAPPVAAPPDAPPPAHLRAFTLVVLGTSTAAGKNLDQPRYGGAQGNKPWAALYEHYLNQARPGSRVINLARPKSSSFDGLPNGTPSRPGFPAPDPARNINAALTYKPDAVILAYQVAGHAPTAKIIENLVAIRRAAQDAGVEVWVTTPIPRLANKPRIEHTQIQEVRQAIVRAFGDHAIDFTAALADAAGYALPALLLADDRHPNQAGHQRLFDAVLGAALPESLAAEDK